MINVSERVGPAGQAWSAAAVNQRSGALNPTRCLTAPQKTNSLPSASVLCVVVRFYPATLGSTCGQLFAYAK